VGQPAGVPLCDPQVQWDPSADRFLFSFLYCNTSSSTQLVYFGWTKTSNPVTLSSAGWCQFAFVNDPMLFDYDKLGHNANFLVVGGNLYDETTPTSTPPFVSAALEWASLPTNGVTTCAKPAVVGATIGKMKNGDGVTPAFTPVPVNTDSNNPNDYVIAGYDPSGSNGQTPGAKNKLSVWHLDAAGALHHDGDLTVNSFNTPHPAPELGSTNTIDTLDARLTQAVGDPATGMYTQHTVDGTGGRSVSAWYELTVSGGVVSLAQQGVISDANNWVFNGAISPRGDGAGAAIFYSVSGTSMDPQIWAQIRRPSTPAGSFEPGIRLIAISTAPDTDFSCGNPTPSVPCRWGDYSGASPDPNQPNVVWGTNMWASASTLGIPAWGDENFAVVVALPPQAPVTVTARTDGRGDAVVAWNPSAFDAGASTTSYTITAYVGVTAGPQVTVNGRTSVVQFRRLTAGTTYTFTVIATNVAGSSPESGHSNAVTISGVNQAPPHPPPPR
jgi:hypothetical protein